MTLILKPATTTKTVRRLTEATPAASPATAPAPRVRRFPFHLCGQRYRADVVEDAERGLVRVRVRYPDGSVACEVAAPIAEAGDDALGRVALDLLDGVDVARNLDRLVDLLDLERAATPAW